MRCILAIGAAGAVALAGLLGTGASAAPVSHAVPMLVRAVLVTIQGRQVRVGAEFWRDVAPGANGPLQLELHLATSDPRGLPTDLRASIFRAVTASNQIWDGRMRPGEQLRHDPQSQRFEGTPGPRWAVGTLATGAFYFRDSTTTYRVPITQIPVRGVQ